jgi:hypothetical protein
MGEEKNEEASDESIEAFFDEVTQKAVPWTVWEDESNGTFLSAACSESQAGVFMFGNVGTDEGGGDICIQFWSLEDALRLSFDLQQAVMRKQASLGISGDEFEQMFGGLVDKYLEEEGLDDSE